MIEGFGKITKTLFVLITNFGFDTPLENHSATQPTFVNHTMCGLDTDFAFV